MSKVAVIGGAGRVGSNFAFHLLCENICHELALIDIAEDPVMGERLDLMHSTSTLCTTKVTAGTDAALMEGADIIVLPAGARRKADQSRLDLIKVNFSIVDEWMDKINAVNKDAIVLVVVNPVDVLTYRAFVKGGKDRKRIFGLGNVMDTVRFRSYIGEAFGWDPRMVEGQLLGEHGEAMVPVWSQANYAGYLLKDMPHVEQGKLDEIFAKTRKAGSQVISLKGGAGWAVAVAITEVVRSVLKDEKRVLCASSVPGGAYGIGNDVSLSLPTIIGKDGVEGYLDVKFSDEELAGVKHAAEVLKETYQKIA